MFWINRCKPLPILKNQSLRLLHSKKSQPVDWKQIHKQYLIRSYYAMRLQHQKNSQSFHLKLPPDSKLETQDQLLEFGDKLTRNIVLQEFHIYS